MNTLNNISKKSFLDFAIIRFLGLILVTILVNYYLPAIVATFYFLCLLVVYLRSDEEALWFAFFLILSDGFFSFFGHYQVLLHAIPGLPGIEVAQFYILATVVKAYYLKANYRPYYQWFLLVLMVYVIFLILQGIAVGLTPDLNLIFRIAKQLIPFALLFTIPKLFTKEEDYQLCFKYLFPVAIFAFGAQFFTIINGTSPLTFFGAKEEWRHKILINLEVTNDRIYRGIYNECIMIITLFGALFYLAKKSKYFSAFYLVSIIVALLMALFLSATRGYILGFTLSIFLFLFFVRSINLKGFVLMSSLGVVFFLFLLTKPIMRAQLTGSINRMFTLEALIKGDATANGTLGRLTERGPRVMKRWRESPLTGWGFSDYYVAHRDMHVGNQSILLHSGIIGAFLLASFFFYFNAKLWFLGQQLSHKNSYKKSLSVFALFFMGWFLIHSSTQYYFSYDVTPNTGMIQALFFSMGGFIYYKAIAEEQKNRKSFSIKN